MGHRIVLFLTVWIAVQTGIGAALGYYLLGTPGTGAVSGFVAAVLTTFLWPWILPEPIDRWMDGTPRTKAVV